MTKTELIHREQEGSEWNVVIRQKQMETEYQRLKERRRAERRERRLRLEERNEALWDMLNRK